MKYKVVFLGEAVVDLTELKHYIIKKFSTRIWQNTYRKIKTAVKDLESFPEKGKIPPELAKLNLSQYRQVISEMNRIIYEIRQKIIYIHIICDTRRDMQTLLSKRLLRIFNN